MRTVLRILAIGICAIILAILLVTLPITNLPELNRYLAAITLFCGGILVVTNRTHVTEKIKGFIKNIRGDKNKQKHFDVIVYAFDISNRHNYRHVISDDQTNTNAIRVRYSDTWFNWLFV